MGEAPSPDWVPVASQAVGVFGQVTPTVQIVIAIGVTVVILATISAVYLSRRDAREADATANAERPPDNNEDAIALARAIVSLSDELGRQVGHMAAAVDALSATVARMDQTIIGCSTCPFHPNSRKET